MNKNRNMSMCCEKGENMKKNIKKLLTGSIACILAVCIAGCGGSGSGGKAIEIPASFKTAEAEAKVSAERAEAIAKKKAEAAEEAAKAAAEAAAATEEAAAEEAPAENTEA